MYHSDPNKPITCFICKMQAKNLEILKKHMRSKHKLTSQCSICGEQFAPQDKSKLSSHRKGHPELFPYSCKPCNKNFCSEASFLKHNNWNHRESKCRYCGKEVKNRDSLRSHEKSHEAGNSWLCTICGKVLKTKTSLDSHIIGVHTKAYRFNCNFCSKGYVAKTVLEEHINFHHCINPSVPLTCDICGKQFFHRHTLKLHRNWHDNPFPHSCKLCDKKFKHTSRLYEHVRRHHTGEKPHGCTYCEKRFVTTGALKVHTSCHTGIYAYNCTECNKGWTKKQHFRNHKLKVHGEHIPYKILEYKMILPEMRPETSTK
jgi:KRAB domain-containing zinc finger protein